MQIVVATVLMVLLPGGSTTKAIGSLAGEQVDLALVLGVDISNSVDWREYRLQRGGLAFAIRHPEVIAAIEGGAVKKIAVTVVQWTGDSSQIVAIPWTIIGDTASAGRFAQRVADMERLYGGHATHIAGMIAFGAAMLSEIPFGAARKVIDISGDGRDNVTREPGRQRTEAIAAGITINGLAIENEEKDLRAYYRDFVIGGAGAFVIAVERYEDFGVAMKKKLVREIGSKLLTGGRQRPGTG